MAEHTAGRGANRRGYKEGLGGELLAEFLGTLILILIGCGSVAVAVVGLSGSGRQAGAFGPSNWLIISWGWGLAVMFGVYVAGGISGAHINPAVSLGFAVRGHFPWKKIPSYWAAQVARRVRRRRARLRHVPLGDRRVQQEGGNRTGGVAAHLFHLRDVPGRILRRFLVGPAARPDRRHRDPAAVHLRSHRPEEHGAAVQHGPFLTGLVVVAIGLTYGTNAGYAINPARDFGPRLFTFFEGWGSIAFPGKFEWFTSYWWIPIVGPLIGGVIGVLIYDNVISKIIQARGGMHPEGQGGRGRVASCPGRTGPGAAHTRSVCAAQS